MANYELLIAKKAIKEAEHLPKNYLKKIDTVINSLKTNPLPRGVKKLIGSTKSYRIRVGNYRIIYLIEKQVIKIISILHRKEAYR